MTEPGEVTPARDNGSVNPFDYLPPGYVPRDDAGQSSAQNSPQIAAGYPTYAAYPTYAPPAAPPMFAEPRPLWSYGRYRNGQLVTPWPGAPLQAIDAWLADRQLRRPGWGIPDSIGSLLATIALTLGFASVLHLVTPDTRLWNTANLFLGLAFQWSIMAGWPIVVSFWKGNGPRIDYGWSMAWRDVGPGVLGWLATLAVTITMGVITSVIFGKFSSSAGDIADELHKNTTAYALFVITGVIGAPVFEELAFRGLLWSALAKRGLNPWACTGVSAVAFGAIHLEPIRLGVLVGAGLVLGFLRQKTGRLGPSMIAHMGLNGLGFLGAGFLVLWS